jgi:septal ring factor EnvC (AmiA/AmiB activator)
MITGAVMQKLQQLGEGDFTVLTDELNELAQGLANASMALQQLQQQQQENAQSLQNVLNPPQMLNPQPGQDNYVNPGMSPRPGR